MQFDVTTGEALANPVDHDLSGEPLSPAWAHEMAVSQRLQWKIRINDLRTWPVRVRAGAIEVDL